MEKRYQVFVSSTYVDLKDERQEIIQALMELDCIPAGMELFPAADEDQLAFIKRVIDDCDYYILLIGGRYGSVSSQGISYTEQEYDYAISKGIKVIVLLHENPSEIPLGKSETDPSLRDQLNKFRDKASSGRLVRFWKIASELPGIVALSLSKTIKTYPARGWVRADRVASESALAELNDLRKQNEVLRQELESLRGSEQPKFDDLASLDEQYTMSGAYYRDGGERNWVVKMTWRQIYAAIGPYILRKQGASYVREKLGEAAFNMSDAQGLFSSLDDQDFQTISIQFIALGLVTIDDALMWCATKSGERLTMDLRTVRSSKPNS